MSAAGRPAMAVRGAVTEARGVAADVLTDLRGGELLDTSFDRRTVAARRARPALDCASSCTECFASAELIDAMLDDRVRGGLAQARSRSVDLLRLGAYQLLSMGSVPAYAAIAQTVELAKRRHGIGASKLANAVLRRIDRERERARRGDARGSGRGARAAAFASALARRAVDRPLGRGRDAPAARGEQPRGAAGGASVSRGARAARGHARGRGSRPSPTRRSSATASLLTAGIALTELGAFKQGLFHLQDPASTLVTQYAAIPSGARVADLCAAPGGKSLELARTAVSCSPATRLRSGWRACARTCAGSTRATSCLSSATRASPP